MTAFTTFAAHASGDDGDRAQETLARAMALPVFFGMFVELVSLFIVPVLYCGYMEFKLRMGLEDPRWATTIPAIRSVSIVT